MSFRPYLTRAAGAAVCLALLAACAGTSGPSRTASTPPGAAAIDVPPYRFRLASQGLPGEGFWKSTPVVGDVDGDGRPELIVHPRLGKGARVFQREGGGTWRDVSNGMAMERSCGGGLALGDLNKDGSPDLVVADHCEGLFVYLGDGKGNWRAAVQNMVPAFNTSAKARKSDPAGFKGAEVVALGDVDGDGFIDIVASSSDQGGLTVYLGDGSGTRWREVKKPGLPNGEEADPGDVYNGGFAFDVMLVDMNGDGILDVVASYYTGPRVWLGDGKGRFRDASDGLTKTTVGGIYGRMAIGDFNRDGRPDIVIANNINGVEAYVQKPDGRWQGPVDVMPDLKGGAYAVALGDLDGDGHVDLVVGGRPSDEPNLEMLPFGLYVLWGDSSGKFDGRRPTNLPSLGLQVNWGMRIVDVDGDGKPDLVVASGGSTGKLPSGPAAMGKMINQKGVDAPLVQVWLNEGRVPAAK